jgi:hypothetical protein
MTFEKIMERINRRIGQLLTGGERQIARDYAEILTQIRAILAAQYEKFEQGGALTLEEMLKHDRYTKMINEINFLLRTQYREIYRHLEQILRDAYLEGYYLTAHAVETYTQAKIGYSAVRPETLTAMLANPVAGLTLNQRLEKQRTDIIYNIQQQVTQGLQKNETYSTMAKRLKEQLEGDAVKAMRIVRTEGHRVQESAKHDAAQKATDNGVIMFKQWNTLEDERVRRKPKNKADHKKLNNKKIPMDKDFDDGLSKGKAPGQLEGSNDASSNINCRCFLTYSIERLEKPQHKELENMSFDEWKKERLKNS